MCSPTTAQFAAIEALKNGDESVTKMVKEYNRRRRVLAVSYTHLDVYKRQNKCNAFGIELRIVDRFYPSSKLCHKCGSIKKDLKLKDRIFNCDCGYVEDRDYNASLNLRDAKIYKIA